MATLNASVRWFSFLVIRIRIIHPGYDHDHDDGDDYDHDTRIFVCVLCMLHLSRIVIHNSFDIIMLLLGKLKATAATDVARIVNAVHCLSFM